jgi:hypothetical protein
VTNSDGDTSALTIVEILAKFEAEGYTDQMGARPGGKIMCFKCHMEMDASSFILRDLQRTEGESDPSDMAAVAAIECSACGARGTIVMAYGPEAPPEDDEVLAALIDGRA